MMSTILCADTEPIGKWIQLSVARILSPQFYHQLALLLFYINTLPDLECAAQGMLMETTTTIVGAMKWEMLLFLAVQSVNNL